MVNSLQKGDKIVTNGGLIVEVVKPEEDFIKVKLNDEAIVKVDKDFIAKKLES
jgi:preprotein translocase subunit YajC